MTATLPEQELQARVQALSAQVEELTQRLDQSTAPAAGGEAPTLLFSDVGGWVRGLFLPMFGWRIDAQRGDRPARHVEVEPAGADPAPPG